MIGAAVLAAGASRRLGSPKQLLRVHDTTFVRHAALCAIAAAHRAAVVVGCGARAVLDSVGELPAEALHNPDWSEGIASSIRVAVDWATEQRLEALLLVLTDQPGLQATHLKRLCARYQVTRAPVASRYGGILGAPALFPASYFLALSALTGDRGAGSLLRGTVDVETVDCPALELDVDTEAAARDFR